MTKFSKPVYFSLETENYLDVHAQPDTNSEVIAMIHPGKVVKVFNFAKQDNNEEWLQIGYNQYCLYKFNGETLGKLFK